MNFRISVLMPSLGSDSAGYSWFPSDMEELKRMVLEGIDNLVLGERIIIEGLTPEEDDPT